LTGNVLGALHGTEALPRDWLSGLELVDVLDAMGRDLGCSAVNLDFNEDRYA
jgi:hypothetical protein